MNKYFWIGLISALVLASGYLLITGQEPTILGGAATVNDTITLNTDQQIASVSITADDDVFVLDSTLTLSNGDVVRFGPASASLPDALSENTNYFVVNATTSTTFEVSTTPGGTTLNLTETPADLPEIRVWKSLVATAKDVKDCEYIAIALDAEGQPSVAFQFVGSIEPSEPNWYAAQGYNNQFEYLGVFDVAIQTEIEGDTGIANTNGTAVHNLYNIYAKPLTWFNVITNNYASGSVTARVMCGE